MRQRLSFHFSLHVRLLNFVAFKRFQRELHIKEIISGDSVDGQGSLKTWRYQCLCFWRQLPVQQGIHVDSCLLDWSGLPETILLKMSALHLLSKGLLNFVLLQRLQRKLHIKQVIHSNSLSHGQCLSCRKRRGLSSSPSGSGHQNFTVGLSRL